MTRHQRINTKNKSMNLFVRIIILLMFADLYSCNYSQEIKKESAKIFDSHKKFIYELGFMGVVYEKNICEKCKINRYTLIVKLNQLDKKPEFSDTHYPPYYFFENDSTLNISVDVTLFNSVELMEMITKKAKSFTIAVDHIELQYLSSEKKEWLPVSD
jgi:hypothetical protein